MHNNLPTFFCFISDFDKDHIRKLDKKIAIIFRNYSVCYEKKTIQDMKNFCKKDGRKFFLSNNINLAVNLNLDGVYLPSFYQKLNINKNGFKKKFIVMGSAHSMKEIRIKEAQGVSLIFISPLFKTKKNKKFLDTIRFNMLALKTSKKIIALGGIRHENLNRLNLLKTYGFAGISYFRNNGKIGYLR